MEQNKNNSILVAVLFLIIGVVVGYMVAGNSAKNLPTNVDDQAGKAISSQTAVDALGGGSPQAKFSNGEFEVEYKPDYDPTATPPGYFGHSQPNNLKTTDWFTIKNVSSSDLYIKSLIFNDDVNEYGNGVSGYTSNSTLTFFQPVANGGNITYTQTNYPTPLHPNASFTFGLVRDNSIAKIHDIGLVKNKVSFARMVYKINGGLKTVNLQNPVQSDMHYTTDAYMSLKGKVLASQTLKNGTLEVANFKIAMPNPYVKGKWKKLKFNFQKDPALTVTTAQIYQDGLLMNIIPNLSITGPTSGTIEITSPTDVDCSSIAGHNYSITVTVGGFTNPGQQKLVTSIASSNLGGIVDYPKSYASVLTENPSIIWTGFPNTGGAGTYFGDKEINVSSTSVGGASYYKTKLFDNTTWVLK